MPELKGQTAFITGGASGIGNAVAAALAREGVNVAIADLNPETEQIARKLAAQSNGVVKGLQVDVADPHQVESAINSAVEQFGAIHILGNIAGIFKKISVLEMTPEQWDQTLDINLKGAYLCSHFALPHMIRQGYGRIVSIASGLGVRGDGRVSAYAASKNGLIAFTKCLSFEVFNHGITANCIAPGITDTPLMRAEQTEEEINRIVGESWRPLGKPEEVAGPFLFLISDAASMISGMTLWMRNP